MKKAKQTFLCGLAILFAVFGVCGTVHSDDSAELKKYESNGKMGFKDTSGTVLVPARYDNLHDFREDAALVRLDGKYGFIDKTGKEIIPLKYDDAGFFFEGLARVKRGGKWGFIDKNDKEIIPFKYDYAKYPGFKEGLAAVELGGREFKIDKTGKEILPKQDETTNTNKAAEKPADYSKLSVDDLRKLAEQGDAGAQFNLGYRYYMGFQGVAKDYAEAIKWCKKAVEQGNAEVKEGIADVYYGIGLDYLYGKTIDRKKGFQFTRQAAELGSRYAQMLLATCYYEGQGVAKDYAEAAKWARKAAEQGLADAQGALGMMYSTGEGVKQDNAEAVKWWKKAAVQGNKDAVEALQRHEQTVAANAGGYSGGGNFEIDQAAAEKAKHDAKFREKVENVQRQIKRIDQDIAAYRKDYQRADNSRRNAGDKSFSPLEKNKSDYAHDMKKAEDKIRELEKEKKRLLDTLK